MIKRVLTFVNAMQCIVLPHITASGFINDDTGPRAVSLDGRRRKRVLVKSRRHVVPARCSFGLIGD